MDGFDIFRGLFKVFRSLSTPAGFIGAGFFITFVGLVWLTEEDKTSVILAPVLPEQRELAKVQGVVAGVDLPEDKSVRDAIAVKVKGDQGAVDVFTVPDAILKNIGYLELSGVPIALSIGAHRAVYEVRTGEKLLYSYADAVVRHQAAVQLYEEKINRAKAAARRITAWGIAFVLIGPALFVGGIMRWRRNGRPD